MKKPKDELIWILILAGLGFTCLALWIVMDLELTRFLQ